MNPFLAIGYHEVPEDEEIDIGVDPKCTWPKCRCPYFNC